MFGFKKVSAKEKRVDTICSAAAAAVAATVYWLTMPDCAFPGESAGLIVKALGLDASSADVPQHMVWGWLAALPGAAPNPVLAMNMFSAACGVASAWLLCSCMIFYVRECCDDEAASAFASSTARVAGMGASLAFTFSAPVWESATHAGFRMFDVLAMLAVFRLAVSLARHPRFQIALSACMGAAVALGMLESPSFFPLALVYMLAVAATVHKADCARGEDARPLLLPSLFAFLAAIPAVFFSGLLLAAAAYSGTPSAADRELVDIGKIAIRMAGKMRAEARMWLPARSWMWILLFGVFPVAASVISSISAFGRDRHKTSQCVFHAALTLCLVVAVAPSDFPVRPAVILRPTGHAPAMLYAGLAAVSGYLLAYWHLLLRGPAPERREEDSAASSGSAQRILAMVFGGLLLVVLPVSAGMDSLSISSERGAFADKCAEELLDAMGGRKWLVTRGGWLDDHLRLAAARRGMDFRIAYPKMDLKKLARTAEEDGLPRSVVNAASVDVFGFFSAWLENDALAREKAAVYDIPDLWYQADSKVRLRPVPDTLFFAGAPDGAVSRADAEKARDRFLALWERLEPFLQKPEEAEAESLDGLFKRDIRRHIGFIGNNTAVCLQEAGMDREAFGLYTLVNTTIDENNISALFNLFEMSRPGYKYRPAGPGDENPATRRRPEYKRKLDAFVKRAEEDPHFRYGLSALSNTYGYINSAQGAMMLGYHWARSGMPRAAIAQLRKGLPMLPPDEQAELYSCIAMLYAGAGAGQESEEQYRSALEKDPGNKNALRGLAMLALQKGESERSVEYFEKIKESAGESKSILESAIASLVTRDVDRAREQFQKFSDMNPDDPNALGMLCRVIMVQYEIARKQQDEAGSDAGGAKGQDKAPHAGKGQAVSRQAKAYFREAEEVVLPKLKALAARNDPNSQFAYHLSRAYIELAKGPQHRRLARDEFYRAFWVRRHVAGLADIVLRLDLELADAKSARQHAKFILSGNNHHVFANYTMGSLALRDADYPAAAIFLEDADSSGTDASGGPRAAIKNDLAEVYRRTGRLADAEKKIREAIEAEPQAYVAHLTLAAILLDAGKDPAEARKSVEKAAALYKESNPGEDDLRLRMTLVRAQAECGDMMRARGGLREIKSARLDVLSDFEREELKKLEAMIVRKSQTKRRQ